MIAGKKFFDGNYGNKEFFSNVEQVVGQWGRGAKFVKWI